MPNVDYQGALAMFVDEQRTFIDAHPAFAVVIHKTANGGPGDAQSVAHYFQTNKDMHSTHYVVGQDGIVVQCVQEKNGAGGNGGVESGFDPIWLPFVQKGVNLNLVTFSIEHFDPTSDNSTPLTPLQKDASFKLVKHLCDTYKIAPDHVKGHNTIDPLSRARCPGNYPMPELLAFLASPTSPDMFQKEADACWDSMFNHGIGYIMTGVPPIPKGTGIYKAWLEEWKAGRFQGAPRSFEYPTNDGHGNPIIAQEFSSRCEWRNGQAHWIG